MATDTKKNTVKPSFDKDTIITVDDFLKYNTSLDPIAQANTLPLTGINHSGVASTSTLNRDHRGYVFFTRPQLNMTSDNLARDRRFFNLLTNNPNSVYSYLRQTLDPRMGYDPKIALSMLVDNKSPFIPLLTNNIINLSGFPDVVAPVYVSAAGVRREQWAIVDGSTDITDAFDIDCTFRNTKEDPVVAMMQTWLLYMSLAFEGNVVRYPDMAAENRIDYNTRIWRIVLDESKRYVKRIGATGASFPVNVPMGKLFDYASDTAYVVNTKEVNIRFKSLGSTYNDAILVKEFNTLATIFNPKLNAVIAGGFKPTDDYDYIPHHLLDKVNYTGYPLINFETYELMWFVDKQTRVYKTLKKLQQYDTDNKG